MNFHASASLAEQYNHVVYQWDFVKLNQFYDSFWSLKTSVPAPILLLLFQNYSIPQKKKWLGTTWGWMNDDKILFFVYYFFKIEFENQKPFNNYNSLSTSTVSSR